MNGQFSVKSCSHSRVPANCIFLEVKHQYKRSRESCSLPLLTPGTQKQTDAGSRSNHETSSRIQIETRGVGVLLFCGEQAQVPRWGSRDERNGS